MHFGLLIRLVSYTKCLSILCSGCVCVPIYYFQIGKVVTGSPAQDGGLQVHDFLVSVQGQDVFDCTHAQVVKIIKEAGNSLNLAVERYCCLLLLLQQGVLNLGFVTHSPE